MYECEFCSYPGIGGYSYIDDCICFHDAIFNNSDLKAKPCYIKMIFFLLWYNYKCWKTELLKHFDFHLTWSSSYANRCLYLIICLLNYLSFYLSVCLCLSFNLLSVCLSVCLSLCLCVCLSLCLSVCLSVCLPVCLSINWSVYLRIYLLGYRFTDKSTCI